MSGGASIVINGVSPDVYPAPGFTILIEETCVSGLITATAVAVIPDPVGPEIVTEGIVEYPTPLLETTIEITPKLSVFIEQVAAAPVPLPPLMVIFGSTEYPIPALVKRILSIE